MSVDHWLSARKTGRGGETASRTRARAYRRCLALAATAAAASMLTACSRPDWAKSTEQTAPAPAAAPAPSPAAAAPAATAGSPSASPAWLQAILGKNPREQFPRNGVCIGNTDGKFPKNGENQVFGWGWDVAAKKPVERVIIVDIQYKIVGGGEGGMARPDVPPSKPEVTSPNTGWNGATALTSGPIDIFGVVDGGKAMCPLGHLQL